MFDLPVPVLRLLRRCERRDLLKKLVGLSLYPKYQANLSRIITLIHAALVHASGRHRATGKELVNLLNGLHAYDAGQNEDPPEDVFVSAVSTSEGQYRLFNGQYPGADFTLQRMLDAVFAQEFECYDRLSKQCHALLSLSDALAERCGYAVNEFADSIPQRENWSIRLPPLLRLGGAAWFSANDIATLGLELSNLTPFCLSSSEGLLDAPYGATALSRTPLVLEDAGVFLPVPSLISPALRLHLVHAIADGTIPKKAGEAFHNDQFARWLVCDLPIRRIKPLTITEFEFPEPDINAPGIRQAVLSFDQDKLAHMIVIQSDWTHPPAHTIYEVQKASQKLERDLESYLWQVHKKLETDHGIARGLTLVIYDSPGWGPTIGLPEEFSTEWYCAGLSGYSFSALLNDPKFTLIDLWKMLREMRDIKARGIQQIVIGPGLLDSWSVWLELGSTFWHGAQDLRTCDGPVVYRNHIIEVVRRGRSMRSAHAVPLPSGEWRWVERWIKERTPSQDYTSPLFIDLILLPQGGLRCVVETAHGPWWVVLARPPLDQEETRFLYLLWQGAAEWLLRIGRAAATRLPPRSEPLEIRLLPVPESITDAPPNVEVAVTDDHSVVTLIFPPSFIDGLVTVDNSGEVVLVTALIDAVLAASGTLLGDTEKAKWLAEVVPDTTLKMLHRTVEYDVEFAVDYIADTIPFRTLQATDMESAQRFMRDALSQMDSTGVDMGTQCVEGDQQVGRVLHAAVDIHWERCQALLRTLDREQTLVLLARLIEATHRDRVDAERGALARISLYADSPEYESLSRELKGNRAGAVLVYRVVTEMALCECPLQGRRRPGLTDIDLLAAEVITMIQVAHDSDAVQRGLTTATLNFGANGDIVPEDGGAQAFIRSYIVACLGESIAFDIDTYPALYEAPPEDEKTLIQNPEFLQAFEAELGLSLLCADRIASALQALALTHRSDVISLRRSAIENMLEAASPPVDNDDFARFLKAFGLFARAGWDNKPPAPYKRQDVWPWLFERRLSLALRPVLITSEESDPLLIYGVRQINMGVLYASTILESGVWPKDRLISTAARAYVDAEANRRGIEFESEIAALFRDAGWQTFSRIPMSQLGASPQLGDLDLLAVSPDEEQWWVVECKWFGAARTPREIANWLQDFHGEPGDKLYRHRRRFSWIQSHKCDVAAALKLRRVPAVVEPKIVTTSPVPLELFSRLPDGSNVLTRRELVTKISASEQD